MNKKARTTWRQAQKHIPITWLWKIREEAGIPREGFDSVEEMDRWKKKEWLNYGKFLKTKKQSEDCNFLLYWKHICEISNSSPLINTGFSKAIEELYFLGKVSDKTLDECDPTGCTIEIMSEKRQFSMPNGVYIKLSSHTTPDDLKKFVKQNAGEIRAINTHQLINPDMPKRAKDEKFKRNELVFWLGMFPLSSLRELLKKYEPDAIGIDVSPRDILACRIIKHRGFKEITPANFRKILQRERTKRGV